MRGSMRGPAPCISAFNQFAAFAQDAIDNQAFAARGKLAMPALVLGAIIRSERKWPTLCVWLRPT